MPSWNDLKKPKLAATGEPDEFAIACVQALGSPAGQRLMKMLHARYINAVLPGTPDDRALQSMNAKRQVVRELEDAIERGLAALKETKS